MTSTTDPLTGASIKIVTEVPGARSRRFGAIAAHSIAAPVRPYGTVFISRGRGALVLDMDGNILVDFTAGLGCLTVGHSHPLVVAAIRDAVGSFIHTDFSVVSYTGYAELAEQLAWLCGGQRKVALFNSGAEAVENAVKVARYATGKPVIVCFEGAFHGRTNLALALTSREDPYKLGFGPFAGGIVRLPYPGNRATLEEFEAAAAPVFATGQVAAAIVEPMLGEGGFVVPPPEFLPRLREVCHAAGALLIADEIQTGYGRTGKFLASGHFGVDPDIVLLGKSLAAGLPLSAVVGRSDVMDSLPEGALGGTYVGNPVAVAAALAVLEAVEHERLTARSEVIGDRLMEFWEGYRREGLVEDVRGLGSMIGVEFRSRAALSDFRARALSAGVIAVGAGPEGKVLRHLVTPVITDSLLQESLDVFDSVLVA